MRCDGRATGRFMLTCALLAKLDVGYSSAHYGGSTEESEANADPPRPCPQCPHAQDHNDFRIPRTLHDTR